MKKSIFSKVGAAAMVLTLVTASLVGGTFAKYTSTVSGEAKATVAAWNIAFEANDKAIIENQPIEIVPTGTDGRLAGTVVPGDAGELKLAIDGKGSEVGFKYTINIAAKDPSKAAVKFYKDSGHSQEINGDLTGTVYYSATAEDMKKTETLYWMLPESAGNAVENMECIYNFTLTADQTTELKPTNP